MCLSTVYRNTQEPDNIIMKNVMTIECQGEEIVLTDLMDRQMTVRGELKRACLTDGYALVATKEA